MADPRDKAASGPMLYRKPISAQPWSNRYPESPTMPVKQTSIDEGGQVNYFGPGEMGYPDLRTPQYRGGGKDSR